MFARIFRPAKTAMQSGKTKTNHWQLEFDGDTARRADPLMGWTSGDETTSGQVKLSFPTREEAIAYVEKLNMPYQIVEEHRPDMHPKAYSDNFSFRRRKPWTH